jgi:DNA modification methylase
MPQPGAQILTPVWTTTDKKMVRLYHGHVLDVLAKMNPKSVHCVVTSPPYWGMRDYGTGEWEGGDEECNHQAPPSGGTKASTLNAKRDENGFLSDERKSQPNNSQYKGVCKKCGAKRVDTQIGAEPLHDCLGWARRDEPCDQCFVCSLRKVFRALHRVLRDDGTIFLNLGDSYVSSPKGNPGVRGNINGGKRDTIEADAGATMDKTQCGLPSGNLCGVPWRVALALQADGWILRSDMPWVKRATMPESVKNRPAKALEYVFMLAKKQGYFCDMEAIKKSGKGGWSSASFLPDSAKDAANNGIPTAATGASRSNRSTDLVEEGTGRNFRNADLWFESVSPPHSLVGVGDEIVGIDCPTGNYGGAHFAVFSRKFVEPFVKCGTSEKGCCANCGAPWKRIVEETVVEKKPFDKSARAEFDRRMDGTLGDFNGQKGLRDGYEIKETKTVGWQPGCDCGAAIVPCTVLDPFAGSATTQVVALSLGRRSIGIDLSLDYILKNQVPRIRGELALTPELRRLDPDRKVQLVSGGTSLLRKSS